MRIVMIGPFGLQPKMTMRVRALPLAQALAARGHQVTLLLPPWSHPPHSGQRWVEEGVTVENVVLPPAIPLLGHLVIAGRLLRRALALRPDVVHCFKPKAYAGLAAWGLWWLRRLGLVRLRLAVDSDDWEGFGGWNDLEPHAWPQKRFFAWQERWGLRHHDALTVASRTLQSIAWSLVVPPARVWYVPNGVRQQQIAASEAQTAGRAGRIVLLYTRFFEFGLARVVEAFRQIHQVRPETRLLVVGRGLYGEEQQFLELCRAAGLAQAVEYAGWVETEALPDYFARADVAIYPFDDTLINRTKCAVKLLDLMAAGVPVVAEAVGQNAEMIEHGVSGLLVPPDDGAALAAVVIRLLDDAAWRARLSRGAQERIKTHLTWEHLAVQVERAYQEAGQMNSAPWRQAIDTTLKRLRRWPLVYHWLPLLAWMGIIFWLSSQPEPISLSESWLETLVGKIGHLIGYAGLGLLWWRALSARWLKSEQQKWAAAFVLSVLYAASDEYHQTFVPGRSGRLTDVLIDAAGTALALWLLCRWRKRGSART